MLWGNKFPEHFPSVDVVLLQTLTVSLYEDENTKDTEILNDRMRKEMQMTKLNKDILMAEDNMNKHFGNEPSTFEKLLTIKCNNFKNHIQYKCKTKI